MEYKRTRKNQINRPETYPQAKSMTHLNRNLLCAIDIKTTGPNPLFDEIYEICIMPIGADGMPFLEINPFYTQICPLKADEFTSNKRRMGPGARKRLTQAINSGIDYGRAIDHLDEWYDNLNMPFRKRIFPMAYNWPLTNAFLYQWLSFVHMSSIFSYEFRDILSDANFLNDYADFHNRRYVFAKVDYSYITSVMHLEHERGNWDTLENCRNIAEVHRLMLRDSIINLPYLPETEYDDQNKHMQTEDYDDDIGAA